MAVPNEVRVNIRHNVLILKTFTVPQLQAITGLNRQSIHSEIRHMKKENLISEVGTEARDKGSRGGRPAVIYQLTSDLEKRFEALQFVKRFYIEAEERVSEPPRPESKHYFIAKEMVKETTEKGATLTQNERSEQLTLIKKRLDYARREEGVGEEGTELIATSLDILEAKATDVLTDDWKSAVKLLDEARKVCKRFKAEDLVADVNSYVQVIVARMTEEQRRLVENGMYEEAEQVVPNLLIIEDRFDDLLGICGTIEYAKTIAAMARRELVSAQTEQRAAHLVAHAWNQRRRVLIEQVPRVIERQVYIVEPRFLSSETWAASALTLPQRQQQGTGDRTERSAQTDDWMQQLFRPAQAQMSEELKKVIRYEDNEKPSN